MHKIWPQNVHFGLLCILFRVYKCNIFVLFDSKPEAAALLTGKSSIKFGSFSEIYKLWCNITLYHMNFALPHIDEVHSVILKKYKIDAVNSNE